MPVAIRLDRAAHLVLIEISGTLSLADMLACIDEAARDVGAERGYRVLSDHRGLDTPATPEQIQAVVRHLDTMDTFRGSRWAVVVKLAASRGMMAQLSRFAAMVPIEMGIFESPEEARAWLDSPQGTEAP